MANTLLATQLLQLRSDEIDRLTSTQPQPQQLAAASGKTNSTSNLNNIINQNQNQMQHSHSHSSLSASSLLKPNSNSAAAASANVMHHAASTNSLVANGKPPPSYSVSSNLGAVSGGDDMNLIQVKKITQQPGTDANGHLSQDNITKQLLMNMAVQQQIQLQSANLVMRNNKTTDNNQADNKNIPKQTTTQIISISSSINLNGRLFRFGFHFLFNF